MSREELAREGSSSRRKRNRAATGLIILRATERKPEWQRLPGSSFSFISFSNYLSQHEGTEEAHQEPRRRNWGRVQIDGPIHKRLAASDRKYHDIHIIDGNRLDDHCLSSHPPIGIYMCFFLLAGRFDVCTLRVLGSKAYEWIGW